jgi:hypothetical protein
MKLTVVACLMIVVLGRVPVFAQDGSGACPFVVEEVLREVDSICASTGRNQACYGHLAMEVITRDDVEDFQLERVGDIADVSGIKTMRLSPLNPDNDAWGVALMRLQVNIPDTLPGQNVTFLLFGDVEITSAVALDNPMAAPMQAFYLTTGIGDAACAEAPESGMLVQTPEGVGEVAFSMNGVDVSLGSTVFFQAEPGEQMRVRALEGAAAMVYDEVVYPILAGTQLAVPLGEDLLPSDVPGILESLDREVLDNLPFVLLDTAREMAEPLSDAELNEVLDRLEDGGPLCGEPPFPDCDLYPWLEDFELPEFRWGAEGFGDLEWRDFWEDREWGEFFDELDRITEDFDPDDYTEEELEDLLENLSAEELEAFLDEHDLDLPDGLRDQFGDIDGALDTLPGLFGRNSSDDGDNDDD